MNISEELIQLIQVICIPESVEGIRLQIELDGKTLKYNCSNNCNVYFKGTTEPICLGLTSEMSVYQNELIIKDFREDLPELNFYEQKGDYPLSLIDRIELS
jgi:hypothetical protein